MRLEELLNTLPEAEVQGYKSLEIQGICNHSAEVRPGDLFVARKGTQKNGLDYALQAIEKGAVAVAASHFSPELEGVTQVVHPDIRLLEARLASQFYGRADQKLFLFGVTGTKGKTTSSYILRHLLEVCGRRTGLLGTIEAQTGQSTYPSKLTTADVVTNHRLLREMVDSHLDAAVLEVSSHALDQGRVQEIEFDIALFTNLHPDHLDYHNTMEEYAEAKSLLFRGLSPKRKQLGFPKGAAYSIDCPYGPKMVKGAKVPLLSYGKKEGADLRICEVDLSLSGVTWTLEYEGDRYRFQSGMIGEHNLMNLTGCIGAMLLGGWTLPEIQPAVETFGSVPGRLERVENSQGLSVFVDFAHSGVSLEQTMESLLPYCQGRLIVLFGSGGDRPVERRESMAKAAEAGADLIIVTSDNPRSEPPEKIVEEIVSFITDKEKLIVEVDRKKAIGKAIEVATEEDIVILAGRGHEKFQILNKETVELDDVIEAKRACEAKVACI